LIRQVSDGAEAMRIRAGAIGMDRDKLYFAIGHNLDMALINTPVCDAMVAATSFLGDRVMWDLHVDGDTPEQEDHWEDTFQMALKMLDRLGSKMKLAVFEENAGRHDLVRGLNRARYANAYARLGSSFKIGTAANGLQVMGHNDNGWDQGAIFMAPDRAWFSPFGYVDALVARASEPVVLESKLVNCTGKAVSKLDVLATRSTTGGSLVLRMVNYNGMDTDGVRVKISLPPGHRCTSATLTTLRVPAGSDATTVNSPSDMTRVSPVMEIAHKVEGLFLPPLSLVTVSWSGCGSMQLYT